jgi:hypothetical protein
MSVATGRVCAVEGCDRTGARRGWCDAHYRRWQRHGDPLKMIAPIRGGCDIEGCESPHQAHGFCKRHYMNLWRSGNPLGTGRGRKTCTVDGCDTFVHGHGLCSKHYRRWLKHGSADIVKTSWTGAPRHRAVVGARYVDVQSGYVKVFDPEHQHATPQGHVKEHIRVMTAALGRSLAEGETVHHRNGVRNDNRLENLQLRVGPHPRGITVEDACEWARMILARYNTPEIAALLAEAV